MKRYFVYLTLSLFAVTSVLAQRYDYDDIYFNPKKDIQKPAQQVNVDVQIEETYPTETNMSAVDTVPASRASVSSMSYTDRINAFHRAQPADLQSDLERRLSDPNYTTNVFVLSDGQYLVDVDGANIQITENYNYPGVDWSGIYWNNPWYYGLVIMDITTTTGISTGRGAGRGAGIGTTRGTTTRGIMAAGTIPIITIITTTIITMIIMVIITTTTTVIGTTSMFVATRRTTAAE